jgi:aryl-phospho-beta-D-glucosidase BglC (GH1 family)
VEPWITPSIFSGTGDDAVVDEYTYGQKYGSVEAARMLSPHWDNWITESDFAAIAANGLNHVRIPIGYWAIDGKEGVYPQGQYPYLFKAVDWCKKYGLKAIIDLHGAPGSQNGFDVGSPSLSLPVNHPLTAVRDAELRPAGYGQLAER